MKQLSIFLISIYFFILSGCFAVETNSDENEFVTFQIPINKAIFSEKAVLNVRLYTEEQLKILEEQDSCFISYDQQNGEKISCPDGVEYQKIIPEEFTFFIQDIENQIEVKSVFIQTGKKYRLLVTGLYNDNCNTTSGGIIAIARSETIKLDELFWITTAIGCFSNG